jgi:hypothetical protein
MTSREQTGDFKLLPALNYTAISSDTTTNGTGIDTTDYESVTFAYQSHTLTDGTYTPLIRESDDNSTYTDVADADLTVTEASVAFAATADNTVKKIGYTGTKKYVRASVVSTGTSSGGGMSAMAILGHPKICKPIA